jgi:hypothetical protein
LIYGGQAGGGKTFFIVAEPMRRTKNRGFRGIIFRRTHPQIIGGGGIWEEANEHYRSVGARLREGDKMDAIFPSGAVIEFSHLQHEKTKYDHQGKQYTYIGLDELTHFTESQFFYLLSRNRSRCGIKPYVRASCNPDAQSWVAQFIDWWIDQDSGLPIPERSGVLRFMFRDESDEIHWANSKAEIREQFPQATDDLILSVTFIPATLDDNPALIKKDPGYKARLMALPRIERERLLGGNWKIAEGAIIESSWLKYYSINSDRFVFSFNRQIFEVPIAKCRRIATIDTAGTSKERAAELRGDPPSWSVCAVWDYLPSVVAVVNGQRIAVTDLLFLRYIYRAQVDWNALKIQIPEVLQSWQVTKAYVENAHYGKPLMSEIRSCGTELIGPVISGMDDSSRGAKLERAVASGMLTRVELGKILLPDDNPSWLAPYVREMTVWTGLPKETADQIDATSYACYVSKSGTSGWGGTIKHEARNG